MTTNSASWGCADVSLFLLWQAKVHHWYFNSSRWRLHGLTIHSYTCWHVHHIRVSSSTFMFHARFSSIIFSANRSFYDVLNVQVRFLSIQFRFESDSNQESLKWQHLTPKHVIIVITWQINIGRLKIKCRKCMGKKYKNIKKSRVT